VSGLAVLCGVFAVGVVVGYLTANGPTALTISLLIAAVVSCAVAVWVATTP